MTHFYSQFKMTWHALQALDSIGGTVGEGYRLLTPWELVCVPTGAETFFKDGWMPSNSVGIGARLDSLYRVLRGEHSR